MKHSDKPLMESRSDAPLFALGLFFVILGFIGLGMSMYLTLATMLVFGILLVVGGVSQIADAFRCAGWKGTYWHLFLGFLYIVCGAIVFANPFVTSVLLTMVLGVVLVLMGIVRIAMSISMKNSGWGLILLSGIAALVLGAMILLHWPATGIWIIGLFIAIELIMTGWSYILIAFVTKHQSD